MSMKEQYLFRGKRMDSGEWIIGYLIQVGKPTGGVGCVIQHDFVTENDVETSYLMTEVDPATIGQCTGVLDKRGVYIFEGDIVVNLGSGSIGYIEFKDGHFCFVFKEPGPIESIGITHYIDDMSLEIIGKISD